MSPAQKLAYSKGYNAGRKRKKKDFTFEQLQREHRAFVDRAFLALLPAAMRAQNWTIGGEKITSTEQCIELAVRWARVAGKRRRDIYSDS